VNRFFTAADGADSEISDRLASIKWTRGQQPSVLSLLEAEATEHWRMFDTLFSIHDTWRSYDSLPITSKAVEHVAIPYCYDKHHSCRLFGAGLEDWVTSQVNHITPGRKLILSCDRERYFAVSIEVFGYDQIDAAAEITGFNSHFVVFSSSKDFWVSFYPRFPFIIVSQTNRDRGIFETLGVSRRELIDTFNECYENAFSGSSESFKNFFWRTYAPRINSFTNPLKQFEG
jgi:hypothetical protein